MTPRSISTLLVSAGLAAFLLGCARPEAQHQAAREELGALDVPYIPKLLPSTATLDSVKYDLATLLKGRARSVGIRFGSYAFTRIDINVKANHSQLVALLEGGNKVSLIVYNNMNDPESRIRFIGYGTISVLSDRIELAPRATFPFSDILNGPITVTQSKDDEAYPYVIRLQDQLSFHFHKKDLADAKRMADDLSFLKQHIPQQDEVREARAKALAAEYRALKTKPPVSEAQRRFIVQANALNQQQDYRSALAHYQKALDLQPLSYPAAYFNMALLSAQLGRYRQAIASMNQYLLLEPEARDARSAQDKIYEWEVLLGK